MAFSVQPGTRITQLSDNLARERVVTRGQFGDRQRNSDWAGRRVMYVGNFEASPRIASTALWTTNGNDGIENARSAGSEKRNDQRVRMDFARR